MLEHVGTLQSPPAFKSHADSDSHMMILYMMCNRCMWCYANHMLLYAEIAWIEFGFPRLIPTYLASYSAASRGSNGGPQEWTSSGARATRVRKLSREPGSIWAWESFLYTTSKEGSSLAAAPAAGHRHFTWHRWLGENAPSFRKQSSFFLAMIWHWGRT